MPCKNVVKSNVVVGQQRVSYLPNDLLLFVYRLDDELQYALGDHEDDERYSSARQRAHCCRSSFSRTLRLASTAAASTDA